MVRRIDSSFIDPEMTTDLELASESLARSNEDLTFLKLDGSRPMEANLNMDSNKITSVAEPTLANDAANKDYVERTAYYLAIVL